MTDMEGGGPGTVPSITFYRDGVTLTAENSNVLLIQTVIDDKPEGIEEYSGKELEEP